MPTKNVVANSSWVKVAEASEAGVFVSWEYPVALEVAVTATDAAPAGTITGHIFNREDQVTRATVGAGFMWVRTVSGSTLAELNLTVSNGAAAPGGGSSDTTEATQLQVELAVESLNTTVGDTATAAATTDTGNFTLLALVKRALQNWTELFKRIPASVNGAVPTVQVADFSVVGPSALSALNTDLLTGTVNGWFDAGAYQAGSVQIMASAGISAGAVIFEQTNDVTIAPAGVPLLAYETSSITSNPNVAAIAIAANASRLFTVPINARFIRVRISTAFVGGTLRAFGTFSQRSAALPTVNIQQATATSLQMTATVSPNSFAPIQITDVASAAITSTATTAVMAPTGGQSYKVIIPVTVVSGTAPTMDVSIEESDDGGTSWFRVYDFPRITTNGVYRSPKLSLTGNRVRYVQSLGGTTPAFTRTVTRVQCYDPGILLRQIIDRTVVTTALNAVTGTLVAQGSQALQMVLNMGTITTTAPQFQMEGSDDNGTTWYAISTPLAGVASATVQLTVANTQAQMVRARVSTAGVGSTLGYVLIKGF